MYVALTILFLALTVQQPDTSLTPERSGAAVHQTAEATKDANKAQQQPTNSQQITSPLQQQDADKLRREREQREREIAIQETIANLTWWLVVVGGFIGALQVVLLFWTGLVSNKAARAAKESADTARMALVISERADVLVDGASCRDEQKTLSGLHTRVVVAFKNCGRTRAVKVRLDLRVIIPDQMQRQDDSELPELTMGPGDIQHISSQEFGTFMTDKTYKDILAGRARLRFLASAIYGDVFGNEHTTRFGGVLNRSDMKTFVIDEHYAD